MKLALFPLNLVVFPGEQLNLHIFEDRYKQLINDASENGFRFGISCYREGFSMDYGTEVELIKIVKKYPDGKMDIKTRGHRVFRIHEFNSKMNDKLYPCGEVEFIENIQDPNHLMSEKIIGKIKELYAIMDIRKKLPENNPSFSVYDFAHKIGLNLDQELMLVKTSSEADRQVLIYEHLKQMIPMVQQMEEMRKKIQMNGHFKNIIPPKV